MDRTHLELELVHAPNDNIIVTDENAIVLCAIKNSHEIFGNSFKLIIGRSVHELNPKISFVLSDVSYICASALSCLKSVLRTSSSSIQ